ncbi:MAG: LytTR family DNA-binding domain-containing protein [Bacteroidota bacterium]
MIRALLIDDEQKSRSILRTMLEKYVPEVQIVGEADRADAGETLIRELAPDLVFLDVEMPVHSGFDLLARFSEPEFGVIFCTAHDHYAISAIRCAAIDYLLKPVQIAELKSAVEKIRDWQPPHHVRKAQLETLIHRLQKPDKRRKIAVPDLKGISFIEVDRIMYLKADNNYSELHLRTGDVVISSRTLKDYEEMLQPDGFFRVSKSNLVNLEYVQRYLKGSGGFVLMEGGLKLEVSRRRKDELLAHLMNR